MGDARSYAAGRFACSVDGKFAGFIKSVKGGITKGEVATHNLGTSNFQKKHLATITHEPLQMAISFGMGQELWAWIKSSWDKGFVEKEVELQACNFNHEVMAVREYQQCHIGKVTIPTLSGDDKNPGYLDIEMVPNRIRYKKGDGSVIKGDEDVNSKKWLCSNFRFDIPGLPCSKVAKIESFTWEQKVVKDEVGAFREPDKLPAALTIPNLKLHISMADVEPWAEWHRTFVIEGKCTDGDEKGGLLEFLGPDLSEVLATISFSHVGIISLEQNGVEANKEEIARFTVELYVEEMFFDPGY